MIYPIRSRIVVAIFGVAAILLALRAVDLQLARSDFLQGHGNDRYLRTVTIPADRGKITDRNGKPLAASAPVDSVWAVPGELASERARWPELASLLNTDVKRLDQMIAPRMDRGFVFLKRHLDPGLAQRIMDLRIAGVSLQREYRRFYPAAEVTSHLIGFADVDNRGQEGIELSHDARLRGMPGAKQVIQDRLGRVVENVASVRKPRPGQQLTLSIDRRIQYVAYRVLKAAVQSHGARSGSVVILDAVSGEVLAMVNQPSYNPNNRQGMVSERFRNRAVTDLFEPGSTIKPFTIAAALESGAYRPSSLVNTKPGSFKVGGHKVRDQKDYGLLTVSKVVTKSSNVGVSKIALSMPAEVLWRTFKDVGFGTGPRAGFSGESSGRLRDYKSWRPIEHATLAFGYGLSLTNLQLARAYTVFATDGLLLPLSLERRSSPQEVLRVLSPQTAQQVRSMLEQVVNEGTGKLARVTGYRVAGKTGTVHKIAGGRYSKDHYVALFAGMAPASSPRLIGVVVVDEPSSEAHFGGQVAAPIFSKIMADALRLLNVPPDNLPADSPSQYMAVRDMAVRGTPTASGNLP